MLSVWINGVNVATIEKGRHARLRLTYSRAAIEQYGFGAPLLSLSLPVRAEKYPHGVTKNLLDGLLPEGEARLLIARRFGLAREDTYGLIEAIGRDCAGAIVIQEGETPPSAATTRTAAPLDDQALEDLVTGLQTAPLGVAGDVRISLGGVQEKLVLTRMPDGRWGKPVDGTPSTHILKPAIRGLSHSVENEALCMRLAKELGLRVADVEVATIGAQTVLVVERFDRVVDANGVVVRLHQEDICQAMALPPERKYEEDGGPSLRDIASVLQTQMPMSVEPFLRAVTLNVLIGNGDAHAKNFSFLHVEDGTLSLSPLYDLMSTVEYGGTKLAMYIDNVRQIAKVTGDRLINEASRWGMAKRRAIEVVEDLLARVPDALVRARAQLEVPDSLLRTVETQLQLVRTGLQT